MHPYVNMRRKSEDCAALRSKTSYGDSRHHAFSLGPGAETNIDTVDAAVCAVMIGHEPETLMSVARSVNNI